MVEENSHDLELQKLLSTSKEGSCANAARLKESQGSGDDLITEIIVLRKKKWRAVLINSFQNYRQNLFAD